MAYKVDHLIDLVYYYIMDQIKYKYLKYNYSLFTKRHKKLRTLHKLLLVHVRTFCPPFKRSLCSSELVQGNKKSDC